LILSGLVIAVAVLHLPSTPANPPGFHRDEASISYNAFTLSQNLHDQDGATMPLYFVSFGDYKSPLFVYLLAGVFRVTGPSAQIARELGATVVFAAIALLGLIAYRRSRNIAIAVGAFLLAGLTPWFYELGRVAFETVMEPFALAVFLLLLDWGYRSRRPYLVRAIPVGLALGAVTYVYAAGRLLAPLLAVALLVFAGRGRWRWLIATWVTYGAALLPLALYLHNHPGALTARYQRTTFIQSGMSVGTIARKTTSNYVHDMNLWHWISAGDPRPYLHTSNGAGQLLAAVVVLASVGVAVVITQRRSDLWWRYLLVAFVLAPIPAALTEDRYYSLRLLPIPLLLVVLAVPGLEALARLARDGWPARIALAVLAATVVVQLAQFEHSYRHHGPGRTEFFEAGVPPLLARAFSGARTVYVDYDDRYAQTHALWYAVSRGFGADRVSILPDGGVPPVGSVVFGRFQTCDFACREIDRSYDYWIARVTGPKPP
jgi:hypothetical protein